ncbi:MAG: type II toxin-antitoxin system RelE/ParE family toxin [Mucilaginibacter polytrichastri]|nr:type II toxin-antitoxin system RelE/ParE family toxin [Mucilaginibacter polytrichastri]
MSLQVVYTPSAKGTLLAVYNFIHERYGQTIADEFINKAEHTISLIREQPYIFRVSLIATDVRVAFISKQTSLFYQIKEDTLILLFFWDNRQEPLVQE